MSILRNDLVAVRDAAQDLVGALDELICPEPLHSGAGLFVRTLTQYPDYADKHLSWISVCVLAGGRARARDVEWWEARREAGVGLSAWDWFPDPDEPTKGLEDAVSFAADNGCKSFILNAEKAFRRRPTAAGVYASKARALCDEHGLSLGLVSYSVPSTIRDFPWAEFARYCDFGVPEIYDRDHTMDPSYPPRALDSWTEAGFKSLIPACGIYYRDDRWNWRTPDMVRDHLSLFPKEDTGAWIAWPLGGKPPEPTLEALSRGSGTRTGTSPA